MKVWLKVVPLAGVPTDGLIESENVSHILSCGPGYPGCSNLFDRHDRFIATVLGDVRDVAEALGLGA